jgi:hypothetical protein
MLHTGRLSFRAARRFLISLVINIRHDVLASNRVATKSPPATAWRALPYAYASDYFDFRDLHFGKYQLAFISVISTPAALIADMKSFRAALMLFVFDTVARYRASHYL